MEILKATVGDSDLIAPLFDRYRQFYGKKSDLAAAREFLADRLSRDESVVLFARVVESGQAHGAGFVQLYPSFSSLSLKRLWVLNDLFVEPQFRRQGTGRALLERSAAFARETASKGLTLKTATDNHPAQSLYESLGWKKDQMFLSYDLRVDGLP